MITRSSHRLTDGTVVWYTSTRCKVCYNAKCQRNNRRADNKLRETVLAMYGRVCNCPGCDVNNPAFLSLDHVNDDGAAHRAELGNRNYTSAVRREAVKEYRPDRFQILCHNCNLAKNRHTCEDPTW